MEEDRHFYSIDLDKIYNYTKATKIIIKGHETQSDENKINLPDTQNFHIPYKNDLPLLDIINYICKTYSHKLKDYIYIDPLLIKDIPLGSSIAYISKKNFSKKGGFLKSIKDDTILELINSYNKSRWYVYTEKYYVFYKIPNRNKLKSALLNLINSDFKDIEVKCSK